MAAGGSRVSVKSEVNVIFEILQCISSPIIPW